MTRRMIAVVLATAVLALLLAAAAPRAEAVSFVDKQVQAGALLIQNYVNAYGQTHRFVYPPKSMVKKGGGLPGATLIWPSNPWTGKVMGPGTSRGTYTYTLGASGPRYRLTVHLSSGNYAAHGRRCRVAQDRAQHGRQAEPAPAAAVPRRLQAAHARLPGDRLAHAGDLPSPTYVWPKNPWTGAAMAAGDGLGDFSYTRISSSDFTLKVKLTSGMERHLSARSRCSASSRRRRAADRRRSGRAGDRTDPAYQAPLRPPRSTPLSGPDLD